MSASLSALLVSRCRSITWASVIGHPGAPIAPTPMGPGQAFTVGQDAFAVEGPDSPGESMAPNLSRSTCA